LGGLQILSSIYGLPLAFLAILNAALLFYRYRFDPVMKELRDLRVRTRSVDDQLKRLTGNVETTTREKENHRKQEEQQREQLVAQQRTLERQEQLELEKVEATVRVTLAAVDQRWQGIRQVEAQALQKIQSDLGTRITAMQTELNGLKHAEATETAGTLQATKHQYIQGRLKNHSIQTAKIAGLGETLKHQLSIRGFRTAADIPDHALRLLYYDPNQHIRGLGQNRLQALKDWRDARETEARRTMPMALTGDQLANIRAKYQGRQGQLEQQISMSEQRRRTDEAAVRARSQAERAPIDKERADIQERRRREVEAVNSRYRPQYAAIKQQSAKLTADVQAQFAEADRRLQQLAADLGPVYFQREKLRRERSSVAHISFTNYLKRVLLGLRST
jgi:hypothetical protein